MTPEVIHQAEAALKRSDPVMRRLLQSQSLKPFARREGYFASLCRSIIGQQVSVAAARAIAGRFEATTRLDPARVADLTDDDCKAIGLSRQKAGYLRDLGAHFATNPAIYDHLDTLDDADVIRDLTAVKGIGVWTAQMFLMFTLGRLDVFAPDDVGLQKAILELYELEELPKKRDLETFAERWAPFRSVASLHLWQYLDNTPD